LQRNVPITGTMRYSISSSPGRPDIRLLFVIKEASALTTADQSRALTPTTVQLDHHLPGVLVGHKDMREGDEQLCHENT
jgi:hypothetical protein